MGESKRELKNEDNITYLHVESKIDDRFNEGFLDVDIWKLLLEIDTAFD